MRISNASAVRSANAGLRECTTLCPLVTGSINGAGAGHGDSKTRSNEGDKNEYAIKTDVDQGEGEG